jgi:hypothetical protein
VSESGRYGGADSLGCARHEGYFAREWLVVVCH